MEFNIQDIHLMGENVKDKLKSCGEGVKIYPLAKIVLPHKVELGNHCRVSDFVFMFAGEGI